ncbi:venom acid phosphatase Acph-1 [Calliopsis andreniformis]|uniref:venom acid phosphatase Acph-1 n=1 Tax=Calliopsis andreniformis TaxID=337506 RepID=UPI003FCCD055
MSLGRSTSFSIFLFLATFAVVNCDFDLQLLHVVFRHGDKVPQREFQNYPTDPYRDYSYYPMGDGDLTNQGKLREYKIGTMLRELYDQYFGPDYWPEKIYAQSTYIPRTQLSLQLVLAGLFPPSEKQTWNPRLPWIPASTFFVPFKDDNLLFSYHCPRYEEEYAKFLKQPSTHDILKKYRNVMNYLTQHSGKPINTTAEVANLYNLFKEQSAQNLTLPKWTETVYPTPMKEIIALDFKFRSYTRTLKRLNGGTLLRKIIEDIQVYKSGKLEPYDRKAFLFSAHEVNVAAVAKVLELDEPAIPAYGSALILETLRDKKGTYYVRVRLWTGVTEQLSIETIPGCTQVCPFNQFLAIVKDVIPNDEEYHCHNNEKREAPGDKDYIHSSASNTTAGKAIWYYLSSLVLLTFFSTHAVSR